MSNYKAKTAIFVKAANHVLRTRSIYKQAAGFFPTVIKGTGRVAQKANKLNNSNNGLQAADTTRQWLANATLAQTATETGVDAAKAIDSKAMGTHFPKAVKTFGKILGVAGGTYATANAGYDLYNSGRNWFDKGLDDLTAATEVAKDTARTAGNAAGTVGIATGNPLGMAGFFVDPLVNGMDQGTKWGDYVIDKTYPYIGASSIVPGYLANVGGTVVHGAINTGMGVYNLATQTIPNGIRENGAVAQYYGNQASKQLNQVAQPAMQAGLDYSRQLNQQAQPMAQAGLNVSKNLNQGAQQFNQAVKPIQNAGLNASKNLNQGAQQFNQAAKPIQNFGNNASKNLNQAAKPVQNFGMNASKGLNTFFFGKKY